MPTIHEVDTHIGRRMRIRRRHMGLTQAELGETVCVVPQQLSKYEKAANRISASTLYRIATALDVEPAYFFEGLKPVSRETHAP